MLRIGFKISTYDSCIYHKRVKDAGFVYLLPYVDDIFINCKDKQEISKLQKSLRGEFDIKDMGAASKILRILR